MKNSELIGGHEFGVKFSAVKLRKKEIESI
jgi:hypothetical protein